MIVLAAAAPCPWCGWFAGHCVNTGGPHTCDGASEQAALHAEVLAAPAVPIVLSGGPR